MSAFFKFFRYIYILGGHPARVTEVREVDMDFMKDFYKIARKHFLGDDRNFCNVQEEFRR